MLFADNFYEDAVGQYGGTEDVDYTVAGEAAEHGVGFGRGSFGGWKGELGGGTGVGPGDDGWLDGCGGEGFWLGWGGGFGGVGGCCEDRPGTHVRLCRTWGTRIGGWGGALHAAVHGLIGQGVGGFVFVAEGVGDLEGFEFGDTVFGFLPEGLEVGRVDFVLALDLFDH